MLQNFEILLFDRSTTKFYFFKRLLEDNMVINIMLVIKFYRIDEYEEIGFPVFSRFTTARTARGRVWEQDFGIPVQVGDSIVSPGDYVIADGSGVVFVTADKIEAVLAVAETVAEKERLMTQDVLAGKPVSVVMGTSYETMLHKPN